MIRTQEYYKDYLNIIKREGGKDAHFKEVRRLLKDDLIYLCYVCGFPDVNSALHHDIADKLLRADEPRYKGLFLIPRFHMKSTMITVAWVLQQVIKHKGDIRIGISSYNEDIANKFVGQIEEICNKSQILKQFYPDVFWSNPRGNKYAKPWKIGALKFKSSRNDKEATVEAWSVMDAPTGTHFDVIVYDDLVEERSVKSPELIDNVCYKFETTRGILEAGGRQVVVGTFWHKQDLYNRIINGKYGSGWNTYVRSGLEINGNPVKEFDPFKGKTPGQPIWPERFTKTEEEAEKKIRLLVKKGIKHPKVESFEGCWLSMRNYLFNCQMLMNPMPEKERNISSDLIQFYDPSKHFTNTKFKKYSAFDPAKTTKPNSDQTAGCVIGTDEDMNFHIFDFMSDKLSTPEILETIITMNTTHNCEKCAVEITGWEDLSRLLNDELYKRKIFFEVVEVDARKKVQSKIDRLKTSLELLLKSRKIYAPEYMRENRAFLLFMNMIDDFPQCKVFDVLDAFYWCQHLADLPGSVDAEQEHPDPVVRALRKAIERGGFKKGKRRRTSWR